MKNYFFLLMMMVFCSYSLFEFDYALVYQQEEKWQDSLTLLEQLLVNQPDNHLYLYHAGLAHYKLGNFEFAQNYFEKFTHCLSLDNMQFLLKGFFNHANALYKINKFEQAVQFYDKVLLQDPENIYALHNKQLAEEKLKERNEQNQNNEKDQKTDTKKPESKNNNSDNKPLKDQNQNESKSEKNNNDFSDSGSNDHQKHQSNNDVQNNDSQSDDLNQSKQSKNQNNNNKDKSNLEKQEKDGSDQSSQAGEQHTDQVENNDNKNSLTDQSNQIPDRSDNRQKNGSHDATHSNNASDNSALDQDDKETKKNPFKEQDQQKKENQELVDSTDQQNNKFAPEKTDEGATQPNKQYKNHSDSSAKHNQSFNGNRSAQASFIDEEKNKKRIQKLDELEKMNDQLIKDQYLLKLLKEQEMNDQEDNKALIKALVKGKNDLKGRANGW